MTRRLSRSTRTLFSALAFVFLVLALMRAFRTLEIRWPRWVELAPGYAVGSLGAFWFIERTAVLLGWT